MTSTSVVCAAALSSAFDDARRSRSQVARRLVGEQHRRVAHGRAPSPLFPFATRKLPWIVADARRDRRARASLTRAAGSVRPRNSRQQAFFESRQCQRRVEGLEHESRVFRPRPPRPSSSTSSGPPRQPKPCPNLTVSRPASSASNVDFPARRAGDATLSRAPMVNETSRTMVTPGLLTSLLTRSAPGTVIVPSSSYCACGGLGLRRRRPARSARIRDLGMATASAPVTHRAGKGWVNLLNRVQQRVRIPVVNASVSGETTTGAWLAARFRAQSAIVIVELGANDGLRVCRLRPRANLDHNSKTAPIIAPWSCSACACRPATASATRLGLPPCIPNWPIGTTPVWCRSCSKASPTVQR